jgi:hypothetical protein
MDINHPLYNTLKDYYINLSDDIIKTDNNLLLQYIEDTYKTKNNIINELNFNYFKLSYFKYDKMYFVNMIKTPKTMELYCHFTNRFLNRFSIIRNCLDTTDTTDIINNYGMGFIDKYTYVYSSKDIHMYVYVYEEKN